MARKKPPTIEEILREAKKKRDRIQKKAIKSVEETIPPIFGPGGRVAPTLARGVTEFQNAIMDHMMDEILGIEGTPMKTEQLIAGIQGKDAMEQYFREQGVIPPILNRPPTKPGLQEDGGFFTPEQAAEWDRKVAASPSLARKRRSDKQLVNDQIRSNTLKSINGRARKKNGQLKKGWTQKKIMRLAHIECTRERERLGLCKRKRKRGKSSR